MTSQEYVYGQLTEAGYNPFQTGSTIEAHTETKRAAKKLGRLVGDLMQDLGGQVEHLGDCLKLIIMPSGDSVMYSMYTNAIELHFKEKDQDDE